MMVAKDSRIQIPPRAPYKESTLTLYSSGGASITSTGPRGGWSAMSISKEAMPIVAKALVERLTGEHVCAGCFRPEADCSAAPCAQVIMDRGGEK